MTTANSTPAGAAPDDPWEELAEQLFGTECGKEHVAGEVSVTSVAAASSELTPPAIAAPADSTGPGDAIEPPAPVPLPATAPTEGTVSLDARAELVEPEPAAEAAMRPADKALSPQDSYWDALADFSWDEPVRESKGSRGRRDRFDARSSAAPIEPETLAVPQARAAEPPPVEVVPPAQEQPLGSEGLIWDSDEEDSSRPAVAETSPVKSPRPPQPVTAPPGQHHRPRDDSHPKREEASRDRRREEDDGRGKRRRRRRRDRPDEAAPGAPPATQMPAVDWDEPQADETRRQPEREETFGIGETAPAAPAGEVEDWDPEGFGEADESPGAQEETSAAAEDDDESGESVVSFDNIPTWEEAISYLLHPEQVQADPGSPASSQRGSAGQPSDARSSRHYGRKHRR